ncbi:MAG: ATP-binding cassette domain-containing protein, partial [Bdellovibrio sp.]|nr:ATP-binding cassette domain-containing protein [Bdellovibrio sp.]
MSMLTIKDISKSFKKRKVVDGVSFSVESGQVVGLLGPNGAGKTTSFYMVVGLVQSDSGSINIDEVNISQEPMYKRARVGLSYLAQEPSIFRKL